MSKHEKHGKRRLTGVEKADLKVARAVALDPDGLAGKSVSGFAELGDQPPLAMLSLCIAAVGAIRRDERLARTGLRMLVALSLSTIVKLLGKGTIDRTRPEEMLEEGRYRLEEGDSKDGDLRSMPSGHSAGVTAVVFAAIQDYPHRLAPAAAAAGVLAGAQLPSRNHFLTDVAAGAALGLLAGGISRILVPPQTALGGSAAR